jgi:hypothetical protein
MRVANNYSSKKNQNDGRLIPKKQTKKGDGWNVVLFFVAI